MNPRDNIYQEKLDNVGNFIFNKSVVDVFDDMIVRSVPGYETIVNMLAMFTHKHAQPNTNIYDLGCSLGTVSKKIMQKCKNKIIAVDSSSEMIKRCRQNLLNQNVNIICDDINNVPIENASVVILNFTLQFIHREERASLLKKIQKGLQKNGILLLSEKIDDEQKDRELQMNFYQDFKKGQGYSDLEIEQKKVALKKIMLLDSMQTHQERLESVGFHHNIVWFRCFNFVSFYCQKC